MEKTRQIFFFGSVKVGITPIQKAKMAGLLIWYKIVVFIYLVTSLLPLVLPG